ncbi:hypothetical protein K7X08_022137 [Anisodus acutangulus]|uniref:Uncharacterized protein n=1 Tax=Anisodus acutangulus TaxID=402998 RepID=A0A9Q1L6T2_9SOLA|nr:hypothetical protein K7X08_022137 [Anisodus acutangulus]
MTTTPLENSDIVLTTESLPVSHHPASWMELSLQGFCQTLRVTVDGRLARILIQNPNYYAIVITEGLNLAFTNYDHQLWMETLLHAQSLPNSDQLTMTELNNIMTQLSQLVAFFPVLSPMESVEAPSISDTGEDKDRLQKAFGRTAYCDTPKENDKMQVRVRVHSIYNSKRNFDISR